MEVLSKLLTSVNAGEEGLLQQGLHGDVDERPHWANCYKLCRPRFGTQAWVILAERSPESYFVYAAQCKGFVLVELAALLLPPREMDN